MNNHQHLKILLWHKATTKLRDLDLESYVYSQTYHPFSLRFMWLWLMIFNLSNVVAMISQVGA
jgi:hypothetical protein